MVFRSSSYEIYLNVFLRGGGLSFYWCISFARYAIYWYKRLEAKESFGMENISEDGFSKEMKGNWWHGGFLFLKIKGGQGLFITIHLCRDFFGGGALFSERNIVWERCRENTFDHLGIKFPFHLDEKMIAKMFLSSLKKDQGAKWWRVKYFSLKRRKGKKLPWKPIPFEEIYLRRGGAETLAQVIHQSLFFMFLSNFHFFESHERWHTGKCSEQRLYLHKVKLCKAILVNHSFWSFLILLW